MLENERGTARGWEREETYKNGNRRLLFAFLLLTLVGMGILYLLTTELRNDAINHAADTMRRETVTLTEEPRRFFDVMDGELRAFAAKADGALHTADEDKEIAGLANKFLRESEFAASVWIASPREEAGDDTGRLFYRHDGRVTRGHMDDAKLPVDDAWYEKIAGAVRPAVVSIGAEEDDFGLEAVRLSTGYPLPSGRGYIGAEYVLPLHAFFDVGLFFTRPTLLLLSREGIYCGLNWGDLVYGSVASGAEPEIIAARNIAGGGEDARESWEAYKGSSGEVLLYRYRVGETGQSAEWSLVTAMPIGWMYGDAQEILIMVFVGIELLLIVIFAVAYFVRRKRYYAPEKTAAAETATVTQLTAAQEERFKELGRNRVLYRVLAVLFFMPALIFIGLAEKRFEQAKKEGDVEAAAKAVSSMRRSGIVAVVVGIPFLIFYIFLELS